MRYYNNIITLNKNSRGIYDFDVTKGCTHGIKNTKNGCYYDCYAFRNAKRYGINFKTVLRNFKDTNHLLQVLNQLENDSIKFIRIGVSGDPSEGWDHLIKTLKLISYFKKPIVVITKHWINLNQNQLTELSKHNIIFNTSISALDNAILIKNRLEQYKRLSNYFKSILRVVSCDFNIKNLTGLYLSEIQNDLFKNNNIIDTVFRPSLNNPYVLNNIINTNKITFLKSNILASKYNKNSFTGHCNNCPDLCGINN